MFFLNPKKRDFLRFFWSCISKNNAKYGVSNFADFSLHGISTRAQK